MRRVVTRCDFAAKLQIRIKERIFIPHCNPCYEDVTTFCSPPDRPARSYMAVLRSLQEFAFSTDYLFWIRSRSDISEQWIVVRFV